MEEEELPSETIVDRIKRSPAQQHLVEQLIQRNIDRHLSSDYKTTYFDERYRDQIRKLKQSASQQTTLTEFLVALMNALIRRLTSLEGSSGGRLITILQSITGGTNTGQQNQLLRERFEKSIQIKK